jgi:hypothetical protein
MGLLSLLFWGLALATATVSVRWGAMIGLIFFVVALLLGSVVAARLAPPAHSEDRRGALHRFDAEARISQSDFRHMRR